jgi:copper chaperone CopZ
MPTHRWILTVALLTALTRGIPADDKPPAAPQPHQHQITGLFCPEREQDLKDLFEKKLPQLRLANIDYANAEATIEYDPAKEFPGANPEQVIERLNNQLRDASRSTFGVKSLRTTPKEKLKLVEIPIVGLDCKACSLAVYEMIYRLDGVEMATASFKDRKATALIDPTKIDQAQIETELKNRGVALQSQPLGQKGE